MELIVGAVIALVSAGLGYGFRLRETIRSERKTTYINYLRTLDLLPVTVIETSRGHPNRQELGERLGRQIAEIEVEMSLVASKRVLKRVAVLRALLQSDMFFHLQQETVGHSPDRVDEFLDRFWNMTRPYREAVVNEMRRDLRVQKLDVSVPQTR